MNYPGMSIAQQTPEVALVALRSGTQGLSAAEVRRRLKEFGFNRVEAVAREPLWLTLLREFSHFFALILWLAAGLAFLAAHFEPGQGMAELGLAIVGVIVVNGCFSFWQSYRAEQALAALRQLLPQQVQVRRDGRALEVPATELVPGDLVLLAEGVKVPADCRLIESWGLRVSLATLTGESKPMVRSAEVVADSTADPLAARSLVLAGTLIVGANAALSFTPPACTPSSAALRTWPRLRVKSNRPCSARSVACRGWLPCLRWVWASCSLPSAKPSACRSGSISCSPSASLLPMCRRGCCRR